MMKQYRIPIVWLFSMLLRMKDMWRAQLAGPGIFHTQANNNFLKEETEDTNSNDEGIFLASQEMALIKVSALSDNSALGGRVVKLPTFVSL